MQNGLDWNKRLPLSAQYTNKKDSLEVHVQVKSGSCVRLYLWEWQRQASSPVTETRLTWTLFTRSRKQTQAIMLKTSSAAYSLPLKTDLP